MWNVRSVELAEADGLLCGVDLESRPATYAEVVRGWQGDEDFRAI